MNLEAIAKVLLGGVFAVRVFDANKPMWARAGFGLVAADLLIDGFGFRAPVTPALAGERSLRGLGDGGGSKPLKFSHSRVRTIQDRVSRVHQMMIQGTSDPSIYKLAREVVGARDAQGNALIKEKDHRAEIIALFNEIRRRVRYTWDPVDYDAFQTAARTMEMGTGDCDDYVITLGAMLRAVGHEVRSRVVRTKDAESWNHIYLVVKCGNGWMALDASVDKPAGWEVPASWVAEKRDFAVVEKAAA